ncbi:MAG TPA: tetratricopeptide repeat protein, partial [Nitrospiria bacterium]
ASVHGGMGTIYLKQKKWDKARKEFEEALRLDPSTTEIRYNLSLIYEKQGRIDQAVKEWKKILEDDPNETGPLERLARYYYRTKNYADAVRKYTMLSQLRQSAPEVYLALGESQIMWAAALTDAGERAKLMDEAAESFQHVLKFDPKNEAAKKYLDRLRSKQPAAGPGGASAETVYDCNAPENKDQPTTIEFVLAKKAQNSTAEIKEVFRSNHPTTKVRVRIFPFLDPPTNIGIGKCVAADQARKAIGEAVKYYGKLDRLIRQDVLPHHWVKIGSTDVAELAWTPVAPDDLTRLSDPALTTGQFQDLYRQLAAPKEKQLPFGMGSEKLEGLPDRQTGPP